MNVTIKNLSKAFGNRKALSDINIEFTQGMNGILGPNGSGKTTLMRILSTVTSRDNGNVNICGIDLDNKNEIRNIIGYLPQDFSFFPSLNVFEALDYFAILSGIKSQKERRKIILDLLEKVNLSNEMKVKNGKLSGGMKRRLGIAQALLNDPKLLIVDEPTAGLDPEERVRFRNVLENISDNKVILLSTHIVSDIEFTCDKICVLKNGVFCYNGTVDNIIKLSEGNIWEGKIDRAEFKEIENNINIKIISQVKKMNEVKLKVVSNVCPSNCFKLAIPNLEDAYIYMVRSR